MRNSLFYIILFLYPFVVGAQTPDLNVTAFHVLGNSTGSLSIVVSSDHNPPFSLIVTGPGGYTFSTTMTGNIHNLSGLAVGEYCVALTNGSGCIAALCIKVKKCSTHIFHGVSFTSCLDEAPTSDPNTLYAKGGLVPGSGFHFELMAGASTTLSDAQTQGILQIIDETTSYIEQYGASPYEVASQDEVDAEGSDYVFKLTTEPRLIWVYHPKGGEERNRVPSAGKTGAAASFIVNPNPASDFFQVSFSGEHYKNCTVSLTDLTGRIIVSDLVPTEPNVHIPTSAHPVGIYLLKVSTENEQRIVKIMVSR